MNQIAIQTWIKSRVSQLIEVPESDIRIDDPFGRLGLDSLSATTLAHDLAEWLDIKADVTWVYDYPTIASLSAFLGNADTK